MVRAELLDSTHHVWKKVGVLNFFLKNLDIQLQLMKMDILYIDVEIMVYLCWKMDIN